MTILRLLRTLFICTACALLVLSAPAHAHVSEGGLVMLLPTGIYAASGVAVVVATVLALLLLPRHTTKALFTPLSLQLAAPRALMRATRIASFLLLCVLIWSGFFGTHNPLENPLVLVVWTVWWIVLIIMQALIGDLWAWINPWRGFFDLFGRLLPARPVWTLPPRFGALPALAAYLGFGTFYLADIAPADPERLATAVSAYSLWTLAAMALFGVDEWLKRGEFVTVLMRQMAGVAPFSARGGKLTFGLYGNQLVNAAPLGTSLALFIVMMLATGSFDGINETFVWLGFIGINPLEFPGRSAVIWQNIAGLLVSMAVFVSVFAGSVAIGLWLAGDLPRFREAFGLLARSLLPIAAGYHLAHYLTVFLVNGQYLREVLTHGLHEQLETSGLGHSEITTGFLNTTATVRIIFLTQAGGIVIGHVIAIIAAHAIAQSMFADPRKATLSQLPLIALMIAYTLFGLWLLAAPRGA